jgi:cell pole-organizing protein PopZ
MADVKTDKEPSIEEILESIRQIISEDEPAKPAEAAKPAPAPAPAAAAPPPPPPPPPAPPAPQKADPILELTDKVEEPVHSDLDLSVQAEPVMNDKGGLLSDATTDAATAAMSKLLAGNVAVENNVPGRPGNVTLEDMTREILRPLIKSWLDQNLAGIIEKMVQKEIEKISRRAGG